jgi:hypothetical protein
VALDLKKTRATARPLNTEQVTGGTITIATDVYALGTLLHVLLAGRHPAAAALDSYSGSPRSYGFSPARQCLRRTTNVT